MDGLILRLLDANANRAREALRVLEDYARFILDDQPTSAALKAVRHQLADALGPFLPEAIVHRDTPGDVGTDNTTEAEQTRAGLDHVIIAAGKRLGEALRSIEEFLKTLSPTDAARVERLRYDFYHLEQQLVRTLRPTDRFARVRLYVLITEKLCTGPWLQTAEQALAGGADAIQLREKDLESGELLKRARQLTALCRRYQALCILNDRPDIAVLADCDGVHVGQEDIPAVEARRIVGSRKIVGVSTHCLQQAKQAMLDGADYIGVGPVFRSPTKPREILPGLSYAREVAESIRLPAVAIAGINATNVAEVIATGIRAIAVSSAVIGAGDVRAAAEKLKTLLTEMGHSSDSPVGQTFLPASPSDKNATAGQAFLPASSSNKSVNPQDLQITHRRLPHWQLSGSTYFITFRTLDRIFDPASRGLILSQIITGHTKFYSLFAATVMPDHVHLLLKPNDDLSISRITKGIKGVSARLINSVQNSTGSIWQDENFDRIIRDQAEFDEKLQYMLNNSVKKGLVGDPWQYDGWYYNPS